MARFVSLVVTAVVLAGCSSEGKVGPPGANGSQGVVTVLTSGSVSFSGTGTGYYCPTASYTAGFNEGAIVAVNLTCSTVPASNYLGASAAWNDGVSDNSPGWIYLDYNNGATSAYGTVSATLFTALAEGTTYTFELYGYMPGGAGSCYCDVTAEIIRQ